MAEGSREERQAEVQRLRDAGDEEGAARLEAELGSRELGDAGQSMPDEPRKAHDREA